MDFSLCTEQKLLIDTVRRFIAEELQPLEDSVEASGELDAGLARAIHSKAKALGLHGLNMPEEFGGGGLTNLDRILCEEQFGHTSDILIRRAFGNVYEPLLHCQGAQIERWLQPAVAGTRTCAIAITEPGAGSDAAGIKTHAKKSDVDGREGWVLNGSKHFISDGEWSDFFLVSAKTSEKEISIFMIDKGLPGFSVGKDQKMMGIRGTPHVELFFDNVVLEPVALLGEEGQGFKLAMGALNVVRLAQVGAREQIAMVKVHAAETLGRVVDRAVQLFGGMGFCKELPIERYYRDARIYRIFDGTSEIHRTVIAKSVMRKGAALFAVHR